MVIGIAMSEPRISSNRRLCAPPRRLCHACLMSDRKQAWQEFRKAREDELAQPHGWLTLQGFHWVPDQPAALEGLPGIWSTDGTDAFIEASPADGLTVDGEPVNGISGKTVAETSRVPWLRWGDTDIELLRRGGRLAIRLRSHTSPDRENFQGVPTFDYDPAWVVRRGTSLRPKAARWTSRRTAPTCGKTCPPPATWSSPSTANRSDWWPRTSRPG